MSDDRADAIARELINLPLWSQMFREEAEGLQREFAAALRSYGCELVDTKLEEAKIVARAHCRSKYIVAEIDALKSKPEAQDTQT